jgi:hypothetical protein
MKLKFSLISFFLVLTVIATAQYKVLPNRPFTTLNTAPGFVTINEATFGLGLSGMTYPFSKHFLGVTSVNGYQVNKNIFFGGGIGVYFYESGALVPLFLDFRYSFNISSITPYVFGDGGLLINFADLNTTKLFLNPGIGARYAVNRSLALNLGAGVLAQVDGTVRESFFNLKFGVVYKF